MRYAIPFTRKFKYWDQPNVEININYKPKIKQLNTFISQYPNKRINLLITDLSDLDRDIEIIKALREKYPQSDLVMRLPVYKKELEEKLVLNELPHFYDQVVTTWDKFNGFLTLKVTDIIIGEEIAFSAKILSTNAKKNHISLRFFPNVCQSSWDDENSITTFFVRPQDIDLYENYFDVCEFYYQPTQKHQLNVFYESYTINKKWFGNLRLLIVGYNQDDDNKYIIPEFGVRRLNCNKRCNKTNPKVCSFCNRVLQLGKSLEENKLYVSRKTPDKENP